MSATSVQRVPEKATPDQAYEAFAKHFKRLAANMPDKLTTPQELRQFMAYFDKVFNMYFECKETHLIPWVKRTSLPAGQYQNPKLISKPTIGSPNVPQMLNGKAPGAAVGKVNHSSSFPQVYLQKPEEPLRPNSTGVQVLWNSSDSSEIRIVSYGSLSQKNVANTAMVSETQHGFGGQTEGQSSHRSTPKPEPLKGQPSISERPVQLSSKVETPTNFIIGAVRSLAPVPVVKVSSPSVQTSPGPPVLPRMDRPATTATARTIQPNIQPIRPAFGHSVYTNKSVAGSAQASKRPAETDLSTPAAVAINGKTSTLASPTPPKQRCTPTNVLNLTMTRGQIEDSFTKSFEILQRKQVQKSVESPGGKIPSEDIKEQLNTSRITRSSSVFESSQNPGPKKVPISSNSIADRVRPTSGSPGPMPVKTSASSANTQARKLGRPRLEEKKSPPAKEEPISEVLNRTSSGRMITRPSRYSEYRIQEETEKEKSRSKTRSSETLKKTFIKVKASPDEKKKPEPKQKTPKAKPKSPSQKEEKPTKKQTPELPKTPAAAKKKPPPDLNRTHNLTMVLRSSRLPRLSAEIPMIQKFKCTFCDKEFDSISECTCHETDFHINPQGGSKNKDQEQLRSELPALEDNEPYEVGDGRLSDEGEFGQDDEEDFDFPHSNFSVVHGGALDGNSSVLPRPSTSQPKLINKPSSLLATNESTGGNSTFELVTYPISSPDRGTFSCNLCCKVFKTNRILQNHIVQHEALSGQTPCDVCGKMFRTLELLELHKKTHVEEIVCYKCTECYMGYHSQDKLNGHMKSYHAKKLRIDRCDRCTQLMPSMEETREHQKDQILASQVSCPVCKEKFSWVCAMKIHMMAHGPSFSKSCKVCTHVSRSIIEWKAHQLKAH